MNEEIEEVTENPSENPTENTQEEEQETTTTTILVTSYETTTVTVDVGEGYPDYSDNPVHELFDMLGVDLDYVPHNGYQCFTMACSLICALWFIIWFCKFLLACSRDLFK